MTLLKETTCLDLLTRSSSHRTPISIMNFMVMTVTTQRTRTNHFICGKYSLFQVCIFSAGTLQGNMLGRNLSIEVCWQKQFTHPVKARMFPFQTYLGKSFAFWHSSLHSILGSSKWHFWKKKTWCLHLPTGRSSTRIPKIIKHCMGFPLCTQRITSSHHFLQRKIRFDRIVYFQCWDTVGPTHQNKT